MQITARTLYIHDRGGRLQYQKDLKNSRGELTVDVSQWLQGLYLVTITTSGDPLQGKLLKE